MSRPWFEWAPAGSDPALDARLTPPDDGLPAEVVADARAIIADVRARGDAALCDYSERFDRHPLTPAELRVDDATIAASAERADAALRQALELAIEQVRAFHAAQRPEGFRQALRGGGSLEFLWRPVASVALYIPGGRAAYPSSVIMNAVPAQVAGVERIVALTVPRAVEENPAVALALQLLEIQEVYRVAGAQSIAAAAYGTPSLPAVDVITGPGNAWVAAAKREVYGRVGIDSVAGPSEVLILADERAPARWIALDLLAQAEHDPLSRAVLASPSAALLEAVALHLEREIEASPRGAIAGAAWRDHGALVHVQERAQLRDVCQRMAPEHLQVLMDEPFAPEELTAGAIFLGAHSPTALGDYIAGPNHVLPTGGASRFSGPLGVLDFMRPSSVVRANEGSSAALAGPAARIADEEGLVGHAAALRARLGDIG